MKRAIDVLNAKDNKYDRNQYEKGYKDGYTGAIDDVLETLSKYDDILSMIPAADLQGIICVVEQLKGGAITVEYEKEV